MQCRISGSPLLLYSSPIPFIFLLPSPSLPLLLSPLSQVGKLESELQDLKAEISKLNDTLASKQRILQVRTGSSLTITTSVALIYLPLCCILHLECI